MRASLATWRARFLAGWESAKLQEAVDSDLLSRLATSSASVSLPRAQGEWSPQYLAVAAFRSCC
jgi:hypothetical protein